VVALVVLLVHRLLLGASLDLGVLATVLKLVGWTLLMDVDIGVVIINNNDLAARCQILAAHVGLVDELFKVILVRISIKWVLLRQYSSVELVSLSSVASGGCLCVVGILLLPVYRLVGFLDHLRLGLCQVTLRFIIKRLLMSIAHVILEGLPGVKRVRSMERASKCRV
jgi:hypothetical protein